MVEVGLTRSFSDLGPKPGSLKTSRYFSRKRELVEPDIDLIFSNHYLSTQGKDRAQAQKQIPNTTNLPIRLSAEVAVDGIAKCGVTCFERDEDLFDAAGAGPDSFLKTLAVARFQERVQVF